MKLLKYILTVVSIILLTACAPDIDDAKKLGFDSVEQMKNLQSRGFKTKKDFLDYEESVRLAEEKAAAEKAAAEKAAAEKIAAEKLAAEKAADESIQRAGLNWIKKQKNLCKDYVNAPNEIKKSNIFRETVALLRNSSVNNGTGTLTRISTNQGGSYVSIIIKVGNDIEFASKGFSSPILRGSNVYKQIENLSEGSCVKFSASEIEVGSVLEQSKVCDLEYYAEFTSVKGCGYDGD